MSNRLQAAFTRMKDDGHKAFVAYICAGDPNIEVTVDLVVAMAEQGVDIIELGIPFTDPMADGPVNQLAAERALAAGTTVKKVLAAVTQIRERSQIPIVFFTYLNPVLAYGVEKFAHDAAAAGVDGILPLDLPYEQDRTFLATMRAAGVANVCLSAPNSVPERKVALAKESSGFLYYVCRLGVTGERDSLPEDLAEQVEQLKVAGDAPVCIGFGIKSPEQAAEAAGYGDGVIVGSHLVNMMAELGSGDPQILIEKVAGRAGAMARAVHALSS